MGADAENAEQGGDAPVTHRRALLLAARWVFLLTLVLLYQPYLALVCAIGVVIAAWFAHRSTRVILYVPLIAVLAGLVFAAALIFLFIQTRGHPG